MLPPESSGSGRTVLSKDLINEALRAGLEELERADSTLPTPYAIEPVRGRPKRTNLDNIAEVIAEVERNDYL